ncbi:MAG: mechanosensitive ion channel [Solirubrobacteraceae bacterium]|nr:mechanosensitive ion channel [Solirubrobacteraceae bacterium]
MLILAKQSFLDANAQWISTIVILVVTLVVAKLIDIFLTRSASRVTSVRDAEPLSKGAVTRLRLIHRLIVLAVVLFGIFVALSQIDALQSLGTALLASSAVIGVALGIAARAVLANAVSGMMLATVQPFRIGDVIEWQDKRGRVEDITLSYTFVRLPSGHRLVIPNDAIATSAIENYTIAGSVVDADASIQVSPDKATPAIKLLREKLEDATVSLGECEVDRFEILVSFSTTAGHEATQRFATREQVVAILSDAGMLSASSQTA